MKIRIVKSSDPHYWYVHHIGEVFDVHIKNNGTREYDVITNDIYGGGYVHFSDAEEVIEHNSQLYRKVDRQAKIGDLVIVTKGEYDEVNEVFYTGDIGKIVDNSDHGMYEFKVDFNGLGNNVVHEDGMFYLGGSECSEYSVIEPIEQSSQSEDIDELDLIVNLSQVVAKLTNRLLKTEEEVAELKRQLTNAQTDIADLEDRVDENEKDVEEVIGRMNDLGVGAEAAAVVSVEVIEKVIAELSKREDKSDELCDVYEVQHREELAQFHDGKAHAFMEAIDLLEEALRNG